MSNRKAAEEADFRDAVFMDLSAAADGLKPEEHLDLAVALSVALSERVGDRRTIKEAIAEARRSVRSEGRARPAP